MASLDEDNFNYGVDFGKADDVITLMKREGWSLDKAMDYLEITGNQKSAVEYIVKERLNTTS